MADEDEIMKAAFARVRPLCVELSREHSIENISRLRDSLDSLESQSVACLQEYLLFPLRLILKRSQSRSESVYLECVGCITKVIERGGGVPQWTAFRDLLSTLCCLISLPTANLTVAPVCEELKLATVTCVHALLRNSDIQILTVLYGGESLTLVGHLVTVLLEMARAETMRQLKVAALSCLLCLVQGGGQNSERKIANTMSFARKTMNAHLESTAVTKETTVFVSGKILEESDMLSNAGQTLMSENGEIPCDSSLSCRCANCDNATREIRSCAFASFLPGIVTAVGKIVTGDTKQGQSVLCAAVNVWSAVVGLVLDDESYLVNQSANSPATHPYSCSINSNIGHYTNLKTCSRKNNGKICPATISDKNSIGSVNTTGYLGSDAGVGLHRGVGIIRTEEWTRTTAEKLKILLERMSSIAYDDNWRVRLAMCRLASNLLMHCTKSLRDCVSLFLDILVHATTDDYGTVSSCALSSLDQFRTYCGDSSSMHETLEESIYLLVTRLPHRICGTNDVEKLSYIRLLKGYLNLLGPHVDSFISSNVHLRRLSATLIHLLQFDCTSVLIISDRTSQIDNLTPSLAEESDVRSTAHRASSPYYFKFFTDPRVEAELSSVCQLLGRYGDVRVLLDHFMDLFRQSTEYRNQASYCMKEIIAGISICSTEESGKGGLVYSMEELESIISAIIDELLQPEYWGSGSTLVPDISSTQTSFELCLPTQRTAVPSDNIARFNSAVILSCLLLETVASCALALGPTFKYFLSRTLYPVLVKLGAENAHISACAILALQNITCAVGCANVAELLRSNFDCILNDVILRLRCFLRHVEVTSVLCAVIRHGNRDMLPPLNDIMREILIALDNHYENHALAFLRVFHAVVSAILIWYPPHSSQTSPSAETNPSPSDNTLRHGTVNQYDEQQPCYSRRTDVVSFVVDYHRAKIRSEDFVEETEDDPELHPNVKDIDLDCEGSKGSENAEEGEGGEGDNFDGGENDEDAPATVPDHVNLVKQILDRCQYLLHSSNSRVQLLVLDIIGDGCRAMKLCQTELLPLVHKLWKPFVLRFSFGEPIVIIKAFDTLRLIGDSAGDFIHRRLVDDILPKVVQHLSRLVPTSLKAGSSYRFTVACKLQLCLLSNVGFLCRRADVEGKPLCDLLHACYPYLSARQLPCLQEACLESFKFFVSIDPDNVWLLLNDIYCLQNPLLLPSTNLLPPITMHGSTTRNEFTDNIQTIQQLLQQ